MSMMRPWTTRILQLVDEGVTDRESLIIGATPWVPQGHAHRVRQARNDNTTARRRATGASPGTTRTASTSEAYRIGARQVILKALHGLCHGGVLVRIGDEYRRVGT